jgi:REP element-mobilizing transposase RayT
MAGHGCFHHLYNRIGGKAGEWPFTDVDKEKGFEIVRKLAKFSLIEVISMCWMGNHFHIVVHAPGEAPDLATSAARWNAYYGKRREYLDPEISPEACARAAEDMVDISHFMRLFQMAYTFHINKTHQRRGRLWADRFKNTILEGKRALWNCVKYVELNPVRAKMVADPADYRFCSWGRFCGSGKHPFAANFVNYLRRSLGELAKDWSPRELYAEFRSEIARTIAAESGATSEEIFEAQAEAKREPTMKLRFLRRTRHWTDGAIIGTKAFVQEVGCLVDDPLRVMKKQLSRGPDTSGEILHCFRKLRESLT